MTQPQQHCDHECVCPDYKASHSENGEDECYGDPDPCSLSCYHRSRPYQSERDKVIKSALEQLELYKLTFEENITLNDIYTIQERDCDKKQLELCNNLIKFIHKRCTQAGEP